MSFPIRRAHLNDKRNFHQLAETTAGCSSPSLRLRPSLFVRHPTQVVLAFLLKVVYLTK